MSKKRVLKDLKRRRIRAAWNTNRILTVLSLIAGIISILIAINAIK